MKNKPHCFLCHDEFKQGDKTYTMGPFTLCASCYESTGCKAHEEENRRVLDQLDDMVRKTNQPDTPNGFKPCVCHGTGYVFKMPGGRVPCPFCGPKYKEGGL